MPTLFISDLHLAANQPELNQYFINLLAEAAIKAEAVYILGDLFDRWIGDDDNQPYLQPIYAALTRLTQKIPCYFIAGNRDFLIGKHFAQTTGVTLLQEPVTIDLYGTKTLLLHGDLLCIDDQKYQAYRRKARNPSSMKRFLQLPLWLRKNIATALRWLSKKHQKQQTVTSLDANQTEVLRMMEQHQAEALIYGHTHQPGIHWYQDKASLKRWIVLGDWGKNRYSMLWVDADGQYRLL